MSLAVSIFVSPDLSLAHRQPTHGAEAVAFTPLCNDFQMLEKFPCISKILLKSTFKKCKELKSKFSSLKHLDNFIARSRAVLEVFQVVEIG